MEIHELIWGKPEQMTMSNSFTEDMIASLTSEKDFLQIRHLQNRILVDQRAPHFDHGPRVLPIIWSSTTHWFHACMPASNCNETALFS
jgi:hypothetical protein